MPVILKNIILRTTTAALVVFLVTISAQVQKNPVYGDIVIQITPKEEKCLEKTGKLFEVADDSLFEARDEFTMAMEMDMTSSQKMYAKYPEDKLKTYDSFCTKNGGILHVIKLDFFDCILRGSSEDIELTLKNFANCMADVEECEGFGQEHLLQEAWAELGLNCILEEEETKKDPPKIVDDDAFSNDDAYEDDDWDAEKKEKMKKEKEAAAGGADALDKEEKNSEYVPKEQQGKKEKKGGFMTFVLLASVCGVGFFVFDRHRRGLPMELPPALSSRLPFSGPSRFARRPQPGFVSDYNLLSGNENTLQLSSNLA